MGTQVDLGQMADALKTLEALQKLVASGGATTVAQSHLIAEYLSKGYRLEPWSKAVSLSNWGVTALSDIETTIETPKCPVILTELLTNQWLTANAGTDTIPLGRILNNAGLYSDGTALQGGLSFQVQMKTDYKATREFFDGYLLSSAFQGDLHDRLPLGVGLVQENTTVTLAFQTLAARTSGDVYSAKATLFGLMAIK